jgi:hypothetical protein
MNQKLPAVVASIGSKLDLKRVVKGRTGIIKVFRRSVSEKHYSIERRILEAQSDIFFMGLSLQKLDSVTGLLEERARSGVNIRLLVPDPQEERLVEAIADLLNVDMLYPKELSRFFSTFYPVWNNARENILVRVYSKYPTISAMMFDGKEGNIEIHMHGWKLSDRIMLELEYSNSSKDVKDNLNQTWQDSIQLESAEDFTSRIEAADTITRKLSHQ